MLSVFLRGLLTGLVGLPILMICLDSSDIGFDLLVGLVGGAPAGIVLGLGLMVILLCLRLLDRITGSSLAARFSQQDPGVKGALGGVLTIVPCAVGGGWSFYYAVYNWAQSLPPDNGDTAGLYSLIQLLGSGLGAGLAGMCGAALGVVAGSVLWIVISVARGKKPEPALADAGDPVP